MRHMKAFRKGNSQREFHQSFRSQSAMEYLMTYGWAILIIAVVLAALFELGVFNPMTFAPKASPGSCQVVRPEGAGTTNFISIEGECNGELPQYVVTTSSASSIITLQKTFINQLKSYTISVWIRPTTAETGIIYVTTLPGNSCATFYISQSSGNLNIGTWNQNLANNWQYWSSTSSLKPDVWQFITLTLYNGGAGTGTFAAYLDGSPLSGSGAVQEVNQTPTSRTDFIGASFSNCNGNSAPPADEFQGNIANVQIYNTALSSNDVQALYQEGIGGAPINVQSLVGWWPLNGNANDYSGNGNNGVPNGITYTSNWYSGYAAP